MPNYGGNHPQLEVLGEKEIRFRMFWGRSDFRPDTFPMKNPSDSGRSGNRR